ncbi:MAG: MFS transporter [Bdellovibrionaceae bacterium]|nr:MFS transporter [Pseudobdellovibrionaceae bacterium]
MLEKPTSVSHRVLIVNTIAFTICFAAWMLNGVLVTFLASNQVYPWGPVEIGWLMGIPVLTGAIFRLPAGILTDKFGGKPVFASLLFMTSIPLFLLSKADSFWTFALCSFGFGLTGVGFSIGIAFTSVWYPKKNQGTALGIFGAGNAGAAITTLFGPTLLNRLTDNGANLDGWRQLPVIYAAAMILMGVIFVILAVNRKPEVKAKSVGELLAPLKEIRVWRFGLYYFLVFGCFVAFSQWLVPYFVNVYFMSLVTAGILASLFSFPSGVIRALGGWMSDKWGPRVVMYWVLGTSVVCSFLLIVPKMEIYSPGRGVMAREAGEVTEITPDSVVVNGKPYPLKTKPAMMKSGDSQLLVLPHKDMWTETVVKVGDQVEKRQLLAKGVTRIYFQANVWIFAGIVILLGSIWGIGKAAVYKHIPDYFPNQVGVVGGMVGVLGGLGGFLCPIAFGYLLEGTGLWTSCWMFMFLISAACLIWMHRVVAKMTKRPVGFESKYADASRVLPGDRLAPLFEWSNKFVIGNEDMDAQHRRLVELINKLDEVIQRGRPLKEFKAVFEDLDQYIQIHFAAEENLMERIAFPKLTSHRQSHAEFMREISQFKKRLSKSEPTAMDELLDFLKTWLTGHIMVRDKEYVTHSNHRDGLRP